tara:strand:+ start:294 stop:476 length:183 start_codon:yes stop_codon:yes gene_type:complete
VLIERINYYKQSTEINFSILDAALTLGNFKEDDFDQIFDILNEKNIPPVLIILSLIQKMG